MSRLLPLSTQIRCSRKALGVLASKIGWGTALYHGVMASFVNPFSELDAATDEREIACRKQIKDGISLYRRLRKSLGQQQALQIMDRVIVEATLVFLDDTIGPIDVESYLKKNKTDRSDWLGAIIERFFNAQAEIVDLDDDRFAMDIVACRFPELCRAADVPELAPLFCRGDLAWFNRSGSRVHLSRSYTIADGHTTCPFSFSLNEKSRQET